MDAELERELDRLYALPVNEFTAARDELAKRLRAGGRSDLAEQVKQLRKPPVAAWLANRLARERELDVQRLLKAGEALTKSQVEAASGKSAEAFAEARRDEQRALARLAGAAREIAAREGVGASAIVRTAQTLRAASLIPEARELLKRGRLTEELEPPGFEALSGLTGARPVRRAKRQAPPARRDEQAERRRVLNEARERLRELRSEERELNTAARAAQREAERAETEAAALRKRAEDAHAAAAAAAEQRAVAEAELERVSRLS